MKFLRDEQRSIRRGRGWKTATKRLQDESGQTLIMVALSLTVLLGFVGFATDVGILLHQRRILQAAADSAAIAGATVLNNGGTAAAAVIAGQNDAELYGFSASQITITTPVADDSNSAFNNASHVEAVVTESKPVIFMALLGGNSVSVSARAVAADTIKSNGCVWIPNPAGAIPAADLGGNSLILSPNCGVNVNGDLAMSGSSEIEAADVTVSGQIQFTGGGSSISGSYASSTQPTSVPPSVAALSQQKDLTTASGGSCTAPTGAGTCFYDAPLTGTLAAGVYYFDKDPNITGAVTGKGVTIFLAPNIPFDFDNNGTVDLEPPSSGPYANVLIDAPNDVAASNTCVKGKGNNGGGNGELYFDFGSSSTTLKGIVYAPQMHMFLQDQGSSTTIQTDLVIGTLCQQSADVTIGGFSSPTAITQAGLVE